MKILSNYIKTAGVLLAVILAGSCTDHDEVREKTNYAQITGQQPFVPGSGPTGQISFYARRRVVLLRQEHEPDKSVE